MSFNEWLNWILNSGSGIIAIAIYDMKGTCVFATDNWQSAAAEGQNILNAWKSRARSVMIGGVKFSILQATNERLIATNVGGYGHIVATKIDNRGFVVGYVSPQGDFAGAYRDLTHFADGIGKIL